MPVNGYAALDAQCPKRWCWQPGDYQHRGASVSGSRNTGAVTRCCLRRAYHGCPLPLPTPATKAEKKGGA